MPERDRGTEPSPWADPAEMKEPEPDWAKEIRARRKARAERLRKVFDGFDGQPLKRPPDRSRNRLRVTPDEPRVPAGLQPNAADGRLRGGRVDRRRGRQAVPGRGRWRDRRRGRPRRSIADRRGDGAARHHAVRPRHDVHDRGARALRGRARTAPADGRPADLSGVGRQRGGRDRHQDGARVPPGARRRRPHDDHRPPELVPRQHARRAGREREGAHPQALHRLARTVPPRTGRLRVPVRQPAASRRMRRVARRRARTDDLARRRGDRGGVHRRAGGRRHARRRRPHRRLLAGDRRRVPAARHPGDRRRGHDRVRQDRALVRRRSLGRPTRHPHRGQGDHQRLRAVRVRGGERRGLRHGRVRRVRARVHVVPQRAGGGRGERGPPPPDGRRVDRAERRSGRAAPQGPGRRARRRPDRRRRARARHDDRRRARPGSGDEGSVPPNRPGDRTRAGRGEGRRARCSTPARVTSTGRTAIW